MKLIDYIMMAKLSDKYIISNNYQMKICLLDYENIMNELDDKNIIYGKKWKK